MILKIMMLIVKIIMIIIIRLIFVERGKFMCGRKN